MGGVGIGTWETRATERLQGENRHLQNPVTSTVGTTELELGQGNGGCVLKGGGGVTWHNDGSAHLRQSDAGPARGCRPALSQNCTPPAVVLTAPVSRLGLSQKSSVFLGTL